MRIVNVMEVKMSEVMKISGISELIGDITKSYQSDAVSADTLISSYRSVCSDPELSDNEKRYFEYTLDGIIATLDKVRNPQIFDAGEKRTVKLFFCPSKRMVPAALKDGVLEKEDVFYTKMSVICPEIFRSGTHFEKLAALYACGCPSRITEVYADPLTALSASAAEGDGGISVLAVPKDHLSYPGSDRALILSCLPKLSFAKKRELLETTYASLASNRFQQLKGGSRYLDDAPEELYKEITTEKPFFRRDTEPADLLKPLFVSPYRSDAKAIKRDSVFIVNGLCLSEKDAQRRLDALTVKKYEISDCKELLSQLSLLGVDGAGFCVDPKDAADYLKNE